MPKGFFISCAIDYPNANLHLGHLYEKTLADVLARVHRLNGEKVLFSVGTDDHGEKILEYARAAGKPPNQFVDEMATRFKSILDAALISYDTFIRTTDENHIHAAQHFIQILYDKGDLYKGDYEGWYCVSDETFWTEKDLLKIDGVTVCPNPHCGKPVKKVKEESYFFRWSAYQQALQEWYAQFPSNIIPSFRKHEMDQFMKQGLKDISFSRKSVEWGIPLPFDESHTIYVWSDALVNYLTVTGYPNDEYEAFWPADIHVIGMDVNRFHSLLWPAMLLSAGLPLPKQILVHGFINDEKGQKLSKSIGNFIDPQLLISRYGIEAIRYYFLRETPIGNDLSFSEKNLLARANSDLADGLGNLVYRVLSMLEKYCHSTIPPAPLDPSILAESTTHSAAAYQSYLAHDLQSALVHTWKLVTLGNQSIATQEPWKKMKEGKRSEVESLLATEVELLRRIAILITPILPLSSSAISTQFGFPPPSFSSLQTPLDLKNKPIIKGPVMFAKKELPAT
ncbi:MAG: methionine--tRNA ligase [Candidatus Diapherotrites archaeon]|nr:methionine--tRNA ligase [Candidatus Diapherotrites archaeon]MDZ4256510.1 methionine--tRNA ligase [archaeon]